MVRRVIVIGALLISILAIVSVWNYTSVHGPVSKSLKNDPRNDGVEVLVHHKWFINPNVLVFDLRHVSGTNSPADVTRTLLQAAETLKHKRFESVLLSYRGSTKFMLKGDFFQNLGAEYGLQNPIYTLRTLPENVYNVDGTPAFDTWTGGWLGATSRQMEDLNKFHREWFLFDL